MEENIMDDNKSRYLLKYVIKLTYISLQNYLHESQNIEYQNTKGGRHETQ